MSEEGELKKRFRENGGYFDVDYEMKEFITVVDEAKKALPSLPTAVIPNGVWGVWIKQELAHRKRWFGDE